MVGKQTHSSYFHHHYILTQCKDAYSTPPCIVNPKHSQRVIECLGLYALKNYLPEYIYHYY